MDFVSFENTYSEYGTPDENFIRRIFIDGFPADEDAEGSVICTVTLTLHGDIIVDWHNNLYRMNKTVLSLVKESKIELEAIPLLKITEVPQFAIVKANNFLAEATDVTLVYGNDYNKAVALLKKEWQEYYNEEMEQNGNLFEKGCFLEENYGKITWDNQDGDFTEFILTGNIYKGEV